MVWCIIWYLHTLLLHVYPCSMICVIQLTRELQCKFIKSENSSLSFIQQMFIFIHRNLLMYCLYTALLSIASFLTKHNTAEERALIVLMKY